jgi:hypothetical protein
MCKRFFCLTCALLTVFTCSFVLHAQSVTAEKSAKTLQAKVAAHVPDLSGLWGPRDGSKRGPDEARLTWDPSDPAGRKPADAPMTPWARARFKDVHPPFGINETFQAINDPVQNYCDPPGVSRIYFYPWQFTFLQTHDVVYILYEFSRVWRSVAMNRDHPKDPDLTWLGDSIGRYEGDTLVVDTIGFNDKTWLDHVGHPHSDALHVVERFRRLDHDTLELAVTLEDPKAYTKPSIGRKLFDLSSSPMGETICSASEMESFQREIIDPTTATPGK